MAVATTGLQCKIGDQVRRLLLTNSEIERFEVQYAPMGIFQLFDQLFGRGPPPQARHVRDIVALGLIGGGMGDVTADALLAGLPPSENMALRVAAQLLLGAAFMPDIAKAKKKRGGSVGESRESDQTVDTTPAPGS